jgi:hypothetical protein
MMNVGRLANGDVAAREPLVEAVRRAASDRWLRHSLITDYIAPLGDVVLTGELANLLASVPEKPFAYKTAYGGTSRSIRHASEDRIPAWWSPSFDTGNS